MRYIGCMQLVLTPELILEAYRHGLFPMAYNAGSPYVQWICPEMRGQLSIPDLHISKSLLKTLRRAPYRVTFNQAFAAVIDACAAATNKRPETWINKAIRDVFCALHAKGHAHSLECWQEEELVGGIYGLAIGGAFFGESMFSRARDASKIALVHLIARCWQGGFTLFDTQFVNDHIRQFGAYEVPFDAYKEQLQQAILLPATLKAGGVAAADILESYLAVRRL